MATEMKHDTTKTLPHQGLTIRSLRQFFALSFGLGWGVGILMVVFADQIESIFGEISGTNPVFILAVYSPAIAAVYMVWRNYGLTGLRSFAKRVTLWRMPGAWWAFLLLGVPAIKYLGAAFNGTVDDFPYSPWYAILPALLLALVIGPVEEFGWRGVALPLLQRRFAPIWAALILGAFWGLWHLPSFFLSGTPQSAWAIGPYVIGVMAISILVTPMFNAAGGSILVAALFHYQMNLPLWPDAQPWENYLFMIAALVVVWLNRKTMFTLRGAATEVLSAGDEDGDDSRFRTLAPEGQHRT